MSRFQERVLADGVQVASSEVVRATSEDLDSSNVLAGGSSGTGGLFVFSSPVKLARVVKAADCTAVLTIAINQATIDVDDWHEELAADERRLTISRQDLLVSQLAIMSDTDVVYGEDFVVYGWV